MTWDTALQLVDQAYNNQGTWTGDLDSPVRVMIWDTIGVVCTSDSKVFEYPANPAGFGRAVNKVASLLVSGGCPPSATH